MKTVLFCNLIPNKLGAYEALLAALGDEFQHEHDELVVVFARDPITEVASELRDRNVTWRLIEGWSEGEGREHPWAFYGPALRILKEERPDIAAVHFGNELPSAAVALRDRLSGSKTRWVWEQDQQICDPAGASRYLSRLKILHYIFDHFIGVYEGGKTSLLRRGIPGQKVSVVYNAIRDHQPAQKAGWLRSELELPRDAALIANVGWHVPRKRIDFALRAFSRIPVQNSNSCSFVQIGEGPETESLWAVCEELGIADRVCFTGLRNDVREILAECDMLVHTSMAETCTYVISEAMCAGIPSVVTEAGAAREQIIDGETGYVVTIDDEDRLAACLSELVANPDRRAEMGRRARDCWKERYRVEVSARKYYEVYARLAAQ
jgi:glycosyltransferase involved in cell wall biosynthesis